METFSKIQRWGDTHHPFWLDFFRMALGLILIWKGIQFVTHLGAFTQLMIRTTVGGSLLISILAHLVIIIHLIGGLMITIGTHTRLACLLQVPVVAAAILMVNWPNQWMQPYSEFWLSVGVFITLLFFMIEGNGPLSVEHEGTAAASCTGIQTS